MIGLDAYHSNGKYGGVIMSDTALDGNGGLFPLAFYFTRLECKETWNAFLEIIAPSLRLHDKPLTFISDKQKGIEYGVQRQFGDVNHFHRLCFRHHYKNMKMKHPGPEIEKLAWKAAKSYNEIDYNQAMKDLGETKMQARE